MDDDIGLGSVTDCLLRYFSDPKGHTQQCRAALLRKSNQTWTDVITHWLPSLILSANSKETVLLMLTHFIIHFISPILSLGDILTRKLTLRCYQKWLPSPIWIYYSCSACENVSIYYPLGAFTNYVDKFWAFLTTYPPLLTVSFS